MIHVDAEGFTHVTADDGRQLVLQPTAGAQPAAAIYQARLGAVPLDVAERDGRIVAFLAGEAWPPPKDLGFFGQVAAWLRPAYVAPAAPAVTAGEPENVRSQGNRRGGLAALARWRWRSVRD